MIVEKQINEYLAGQSEPKRSELNELHQLILGALQGTKLWFDDGKNEQGKVVSNPSIGYGLQIIEYADGKKRDYFQVGLSANTAGISVYILGIKDKTYLLQTYGATLGKATVTGYCIKFKKLKDINLEVLEIAIKDGVELTKIVES